MQYEHRAGTAGPVLIHGDAVYTVEEAAAALRVSVTKFRELAVDIPVLGYKDKPKLFWGDDLVEFCRRHSGRDKP